MKRNDPNKIYEKKLSISNGQKESPSATTTSAAHAFSNHGNILSAPILINLSPNLQPISSKPFVKVYRFEIGIIITSPCCLLSQIQISRINLLALRIVIGLRSIMRFL